MDFVLTLIAGPEGGLSEAEARRIGRIAGELANSESGVPDWLAPGIACDISLQGRELDNLRATLRQALAEAPVDAVLQPAANRRKMLLLADMDSTIVTSETLDELADCAGIKDRIAAITDRAMRGEIDFQGALRERVSMLKGLSADALDRTLAGIELTPGARALVRTMRANGAYTALVSGGFRFFTSRIADRCGFHEDRANRLIVENGVLTGEVSEPILDKDSKLASLREIAKQRTLPLSSTMATGDGANDLPMIEAAGLGVAFRAKPAVEAAAPAAIRHGDLTALLYIQGYRQSDFIVD